MRFIIFIALFFHILGAKEAIAMSEAKQIELPKPATRGSMSLEEAISKRRSQRSFASGDLSQEQISQLLWSAQGITANKGGFSLRSAPSAGALYPIEVYLLTRGGLFHYIPEGHKLEVLSEADLRKSLALAALGQASVSQAPADIVICAVYSRVAGKYGQRASRYVDIEAGHVAENIHLQAVALGLGSVPVGAFNDEDLKRILSLPQEQEPLYIIPVGYIE